MDHVRRAIWRPLPVIGLALAWQWSTDWSWWGIMLGAALPMLSGLPIGDVWVGAMLGSWIGLTGIVFAWTFAHGAGIMLWCCYQYGVIGWPGDWPFTPFVIIPALIYTLIR